MDLNSYFEYKIYYFINIWSGHYGKSSKLATNVWLCNLFVDRIRTVDWIINVDGKRGILDRNFYFVDIDKYDPWKEGKRPQNPVQRVPLAFAEFRGFHIFILSSPHFHNYYLLAPIGLLKFICGPYLIWYLTIMPY